MLKSQVFNIGTVGEMNSPNNVHFTCRCYLIWVCICWFIVFIISSGSFILSAECVWGQNLYIWLEWNICFSFCSFFTTVELIHCCAPLALWFVYCIWHFLGCSEHLYWFNPASYRIVSLIFKTLYDTGIWDA